MGKSRVYLNGRLLSEHYGGFLPVIVDLSEAIEWEADNVIAVWSDNSDDPSYPPGKAQAVLDFAYFGGIYRDCWLVAHNKAYITDPNYVDETAGGGLFVAYDKVSEEKAEILLQVQVQNEMEKSFSGSVEFELQQPDGKTVSSLHKRISVRKGKAATTSGQMHLMQPALWSPSTPYLYNLLVRVKDKEGNIKRLNNYFIQFDVEGEARLLGNAENERNPAPVNWGTAPVLLQSTLKAGKIKVTASVLFDGIHQPVKAELWLESKPSGRHQVYNADEAKGLEKNITSSAVQSASQTKEQEEITRLKRELNNYKLKEVEKQQEEFGEKK